MEKYFEVTWKPKTFSNRRRKNTVTGNAKDFADAYKKSKENCPEDMYVAIVKEVRFYLPDGTQV